MTDFEKGTFSISKLSKVLAFPTIAVLAIFFASFILLRAHRCLGFRVVKEINIAGNDFIPHWDGCLLLRCDIDKN